MKLRSFLSLFLCAFVLNCFSQAMTGDGNTVVPHKLGDPRVKPLSMGETFAKYADEIEAWRENPAMILAELGPDKSWDEDVKEAKASGGHVVEAVITPGEAAELCMVPADAYKVTHLKLTGRAQKWGEYGPDDLGLPDFLRSLKNLKVLNLRDLDCEIIYLDRLKNIEKIVLPANCTSARVTGNDKLKELVIGPRFEAFGYVLYETDKKSYRSDMTRSFLDLGMIKDFKFPEGTLYVGGFMFGKGTQSVTFPSTLKFIEYFGNTFTMSPYAHMQIPALKEIHVNSSTPPVIKNFPFEYEHLKNVTLYVPRGAKSNYMKDLKWRNFGAIVEEDVVIEERPVDDDLVIVKEITKEDILGTWKFAKFEVYDPKGLLKNPVSPVMDWMKLSENYWEEPKKDGSINQMRYYFIEGDIYLGTQRFNVDKADEKELILSVDEPTPNVEVKYIFKFLRME